MLMKSCLDVMWRMSCDDFMSCHHDISLFKWNNPCFIQFSIIPRAFKCVDDKMLISFFSQKNYVTLTRHDVMTRSHRKSRLTPFRAENISRKSHKRNFGCWSICLSNRQKCTLGVILPPPPHLAVEGLRLPVLSQSLISLKSSLKFNSLEPNSIISIQHLKQHTILNTYTLLSRKTKMFWKSMCCVCCVRATPTCQSSQLT